MIRDCGQVGADVLSLKEDEDGNIGDRCLKVRPKSFTSAIGGEKTDSDQSFNNRVHNKEKHKK
jgi:hypothetical protein